MDIKVKVSISLLFFVFNISIIRSDDKSSRLVSFLSQANNELERELNKMTRAAWTYETDINNKTVEEKKLVQKALNDFIRKLSSKAKEFNTTNISESNQRLIEKMSVVGTAALNKQDENQYQTVTNQMETTYSSAKVCVGGKCGLELDPDLSNIMSESTNSTKLLEAWVNWRDASGKKMRSDFITYFTLGNKAAKLNILPNKKLNTLDELWLFSWETPDIKEQTAEILEQIKPFYKKIHAYVRIKLSQKYPGQMPKDGTIPAHLLGNMWAQQWGNIMKTVGGVDPFPDLAPIDVTKTLKEKMFELSEKFFVDLGLDPMTDKFWNYSILDKLKDKVMVCHASAWDLYETDDFRIKMCTNKNMEDLITIHHEMGHIQYYQQYKERHVLFREGANPGFHEAIGDLLALSVTTTKHLKKIGLLKMSDSPEIRNKLNRKYLLKMGLDKIAFLPFAYIMDKWRWDVFSGKVSTKDMNRHWWQLSGQHHGISPPVNRSENDFDPGAKYHIPAGVEYIRYFVSFILQFQFHKKLCSFREKDVPLYECDIDGDLKAGNALKKMLQKGSSEKWPKQLKDFVGTEKMDIKPLLEYFEPLQVYLDEQLKGQRIGWTFKVDDYFKSSSMGYASNSIASVKVNTISLFFGIFLSIAFIRIYLN